MPYVLSALTFTVLVALLVPPIQGFDEGAHYVRADEISHGEFLARRLDAEHAGGQIDRGVIAAIDIFYPLATNRTPLLTRALLAPIPWGPVTLWSFPNTAVYPPPYYLPMAAAIRLGKALGFDVVRTLRLSRLVNALVCVTVAGIAVALAESGAIWLVALLLLPSSVALMGSMTQDGLCLATAALAGSLTLRLRRPVPRRGGPHVLLCVVLAVLAMCRPPYAGLALLPLAASGLPVRMRYVGVAASLAAAAAWWAYCAAYVFVSVDPSHQAHAGAQLLLILTPPWRIVLLMANTLLSHFRQEYAGYFITTFQSPSIYNGVAWAVLTLAFLAMRAGHDPGRRPSEIVAASAILLSVAGIFAIQYLTWTPVGATSINGVQGRYFLPLAAILVMLAPSPGLDRPRRADWAALPVMLFPVASMVATVHALVLRYYLPSS